MQKLIKILPILGFILSVGAAFAFNTVDASIDEAVYYRQADGDFLEKTGPGTCQLGQWNCEYEYIGDGTPVIDQDEESYMPVGQANRVFQPTAQ